MDCLSDDRLVDFLKGELGPAEREASEAHVDACQACFSLVASAMRLGEAATSAPSLVEPSEPQRPGDAGDLPPSFADGRYVIQALLGEGGAGAVYRADDVQLGRQIALKIVKAPKAFAGMVESMQARLLREGRAMARVSHPNVVAVYDVGSIGDRVYLVMELVEGRTLAFWLREQSRPWREVTETFMAAGVGLAAAHRVGLVHRDFKPLNVLVGLDGRVRVTDFGLARPVAHAEASDATPSDTGLVAHPEWTLTMTGGLVGTPRYMAPEQFRAGPADARSDQFSFCVSLFMALYGRHPFVPEGLKKPSVQELSQFVLQGRLCPPASSAGIPAGVLSVLWRGLAADPAERYPNMDRLIAGLASELKSAAPASGKHRREALLAAAGVTVLLGAGGYVLLSGSETRSGGEARPKAVASVGPAPAGDANAAPTARASASQQVPVGSSATPAGAVAQRVSLPPKPRSKAPAKPAARPADPDGLKNPF